MAQTFADRVSISAGFLADQCGGGAHSAALLTRMFRAVAAPWCDAIVGREPPFANDISDDGSPYEFSVAARGEQLDLRLLVEPQGAPYGLQHNFRAGLAANRRLSAEFGADFQACDAVVDLFAPATSSQGRFAFWHGLVVDPRGSALAKAYLNPRLHGDEQAVPRVLEALDRCGFHGAHAYLRATAQHAIGLPYFALDLCAPERARMKFYLALRDLEAVQRLLGSAVAASQLAGTAGPYTSRPLLVCASFRRDDAEPELTLHVPVRCYASSDAESLSRLAPWASEAVRARVARCVGALDQAHEGRQVVSYLSLKVNAENAFTAYLCPRLYGAADASSVRTLPSQRAPETMRDVEASIAQRAAGLAEHPFMERIAASRDVAEFRSLLQRLGFFTLVFQDVLRLARGACRDDAVRAVCEDLARGDAGHELWYLRDLRRLSVKLDLDVVFRSDYREARDLTYELLAIIAGCDDDCARLSALLVLEGAAELFFTRVPAFARRCGVEEPLEYFGEKHLAAEHAHAIHQAGAGCPLEPIRVPSASQRVVHSVIERTFAVMVRLASDLDRSMGAAQAA